MSSGLIREVLPSEGPVISYEITGHAEALKVAVDGQEMDLTIFAHGSDQGWCHTPDGKPHRFFLSWAEDQLHLWLDGYLFVYQRVDARPTSRREQVFTGDDIVAPMPGTVAEILVQPGDQVERGQTVMVMESMKMELLIAAPRAGVVLRLPVEPGSQVDKGMRLLELQELQEIEQEEEVGEG